MKIKIKWLGTGSGLNLELGNTSFLIFSDDSDRVVLVDCGFTVPLRLMEQNLMAKVTDVIITHIHADHVGGLESFGFYQYYALKNRKEKRPTLHLGSGKLARDLWNHSLRAGMEKNQTETNLAFDAGLETFFQVSAKMFIEIPGFPTIAFLPANHVQEQECYSILIPEKRFYYSGDSIDMPPDYYDIIFQDCQFYETISDVHASYNKLLNLKEKTRKNTWLVHLGAGWEKYNPEKDGFAGFAMPGQIFEF